MFKNVEQIVFVLFVFSFLDVLFDLLRLFHREKIDHLSGLNIVLENHVRGNIGADLVTILKNLDEAFIEVLPSLVAERF